MKDLSATRKIASISTQSRAYFVGTSSPGFDYYDKITAEEKPGDMAYILWYQLWRNGEVVREVNSLLVIDVEYFPVEKENIPF